MLTIYCERCYAANPEGESVCAQCGAVLDAEAPGDYTERLLWALHHPEPTVAPRVAWILGERRDARAVEPLIALIERSGDAAQHTYGMYSAGAGIPMGVLEEAAVALGKIGDPRAVPALERLLRGSYVSVRERAAWALGQIGDPRARTALRQALGDRSAGVRAAARRALERWEPCRQERS